MKGQDSGEPYLRWTFKIIDGKYKGQQPRDLITSLQEQALFNLRNLLEALGVEVPSSKVKLKYSKYLERQAGISIETEEYQGRKQSNIVDVFPTEELVTEEKAEEPVEEEEGGIL